MKELLKCAKNLEQDFTNPNTTYQSKIDLAFTSLVMGDYDKSKQMFDAAIELDSMYPSAWLRSGTLKNITIALKLMIGITPMHVFTFG